MPSQRCRPIHDRVEHPAFQPVAEFGERMERYIAELKSVPLAQGFDEIVYPSELEARNGARHRAEGLLLPDDTLADLQQLAEASSLQSKLPF
jgi:LDH2 family malate/lactate/ureidoglycolate dehydrogenase